MILQSDSPSHIAFSDESCWNTNQFRSISLVSCSYVDYKILNSQLSSLIEESQHKEIKWSSITESTGIRLIDFVFCNLHKLRVDVLIWNMEDSRHKDLLKRDDTEDFCRMYFHLIRNVLTKRWPNTCAWALHPDEHDCVRWESMEKHLNDKSWGISDTIVPSSSHNISFAEYYRIVKFRPVVSKDYPFVQLADVFAGLGTYSYLAYCKYELWMDRISGQSSIFDFIEGPSQNIDLTGRDFKRLPILQHLNSKAKARHMSISLRNNRGLKSFDNSSSINFWLYTPQSPQDKAPIKKVPSS